MFKLVFHTKYASTCTNVHVKYIAYTHVTHVPHQLDHVMFYSSPHLVFVQSVADHCLETGEVGLLLTDWLVFPNFLCTGMELCKTGSSIPRPPFSALYVRKVVAKGVPWFLNRVQKIESELAISLCVGEQCVMTSGTLPMQLLCADNLDSPQLVCYST